ncbi:MAG: chromate transporter [Treponema sp.]|nr:chromate transporter [Treponema sp.]
MKELLELFWAFFVIGASAFGGGYAIMPILEREIFKKRGWITEDEVLDFFAIAQITPGVIAVNIATFVGYKRKGFIGGIIATIGLVLPGVSLMLFVSFFFTQFTEYPAVQHALSGIRLAVCALVFNMIIKLLKSFFKNYKAIIIFIICFVLAAIFDVSPMFIIPGAGLAGFFFFSTGIKKKKSNPHSGDEN